jgi:hypothetical protein
MQEVVTRQHWRGAEVYKAEALDGHGWKVILWRIPQVSGGYAVVEISEKGEVINYTPGL